MSQQSQVGTCKVICENCGYEGDTYSVKLAQPQKRLIPQQMLCKDCMDKLDAFEVVQRKPVFKISRFNGRR